MKIFLLLFMILPNLAFAEDFTLLCDGEMSTYRNDVLENTTKQVQTLKV